MSGTPLRSHSGLWLNFSEAALAHPVDAKHKRAEWRKQPGEALQPSSPVCCLWRTVGFTGTAAGLKIKAENILWQTENTLTQNKTEEMNPFIS